jgi:glucosamine--fructose-6-phosphate aminotransferase (isomerizing)
MRDEIFEQPDIVARLAADPAPYRHAVAGARAAGARFVLYAARGTSDNAAVYGKYLATIHAGLPAGLAVPSSATVYDTPLDLRECLVVGISQSGETPDVAEYVAHARAAGAYTVAITNDDDSLLARHAHAVLPTLAGHERAVAATKTYASELAALALFWATWCDDATLLAALRDTVPAAMRAALALDEAVAEISQWLRFSERLLVAARGYNFASALETALKLKETSYIAAMPYSAADLMHGPVAMVEPGYPALLFSLPGRALPAMRRLESDLLERGAELVVVEDAHDAGGAGAAAPVAQRPARGEPAAGAGAAGESARRRSLRLPQTPPEPLSPLVAIVPGQLLAARLAEARGYDPDRPRGLHKVTRTL